MQTRTWMINAWPEVHLNVYDEKWPESQSYRVSTRNMACIRFLRRTSIKSSGLLYQSLRSCIIKHALHRMVKDGILITWETLVKLALRPNGIRRVTLYMRVTGSDNIKRWNNVNKGRRWFLTVACKRKWKYKQSWLQNFPTQGMKMLCFHCNQSCSL